MIHRDIDHPVLKDVNQSKLWVGYTPSTASTERSKNIIKRPFLHFYTRVMWVGVTCHFAHTFTELLQTSVVFMVHLVATDSAFSAGLSKNGNWTLIVYGFLTDVALSRLALRKMFCLED